eukprot:10641285-Karenia_brevis.AAC.1
MSEADIAHMRSHGGCFASVVLVGVPTAKGFKVQAHDFRTLILQGLRLPLSLTESMCERCGGALDSIGCH